MKLVILDGGTANPGDISWAPIEALGETAIYPTTRREEIVSRAAGCEVIVDNKVPITREVLRELPDLKLIALLATGYNIIDTDACREYGVKVANVPAYSTSLVAQHTFALLLEHYHNVGLHSRSVHDGEWDFSKNFCFWKEPLFECAGKTFGIFGFGSIGKRVAEIARAFEMEVIACSRRPFTHPFVRQVDYDTLLRQSDVLSFHCPLTDATRGVLNAEAIEKMKPTAIVLNTSRGPVLDEEALADALNRGRIAGAGVDVLSTEPPAPDNPLLTARNCFITPHTAWAARETRERLVAEVAENIRSNLAGVDRNLV